MEIINDTAFHVEALPFAGPDGDAFVTIIVKGTFEFAAGGLATISDEQIPIAFGDELNDPEDGGSIKFEADIAQFKPRADIALVGSAYAPNDQPASVLDVKLRVGRIQKTLRIVGDRRWKGDGWSNPEPFERMEIIYERAFGGIDETSGEFCARNLVGRGFLSKQQKKIPDHLLLPNVEDPDQLLRSWEDPPKPVGFGFISKAWMPRAQYAGTYDEAWRKARSPNLPEDFSFEYHNAAHPDLQMEGYLKGDEEVELINLTPEGAARFQLPDISVRCRVAKLIGVPDEDSSAPSVKEEISMRLDTLCLIPDERRFYLVWRGCCPVGDLDALELKQIEIFL